MSIERKPKRMVDIDLFTHPKMRGTSAMAKALFVFLLLPSPSGINCLSIRQMRLMVDASATDDQVRAALGQLCDVGVVRWDPDNEVVWVVKALERQAGGASPKIGTCVAHHLDTLPPSPLLDEFRDRYHGWLVRAGVIESENEEPAPAPSLRLVSVRDSEPDTLSRYPIQVPYGISDTDTETATEPVKEVEDWSSSREETVRESRTPPLLAALNPEAQRAELERELVDLVISANVGAGLGADGRYVADIVRRIEAGDCTTDDVRSVAVRYKRWKDEGTTQKPFHVLFYDNVWPVTLRSYLDRTPPPTARKPHNATTSFNRASQRHWANVVASAPPPPVLSAEERERLCAEGAAELDRMGWL